MTEELGGATVQQCKSQILTGDMCAPWLYKEERLSLLHWLIAWQGKAWTPRYFSCNFLLWYLLTLGIMLVFSLRWSLSPALGRVPKQPDSGRPRPGMPGSHYQPRTIHRLGLDQKDWAPWGRLDMGLTLQRYPFSPLIWQVSCYTLFSDCSTHGHRPAVNISYPPVEILVYGLKFDTIIIYFVTQIIPALAIGSSSRLTAEFLDKVSIIS